MALFGAFRLRNLNATQLAILCVNELALSSVNVLIHGEETPMRTYVAVALLLLSPGWCVAQIEAVDVATECLIGSVVATAPPLIGESFGSQLAAARTCLADEDADCAEEVIDGIDTDTLNDDERAILALLRGDREALDGNARRTRREYRRALEESGANRQIVRAAVERLVRLHLENDDPDDALEQLQALECGDWRPELLVLQARAQFGLRDFEDAQVSIQSAIDSQQASGADVPEDWHLFQAANLRSAEMAADDDVRCVDESPVGSRIPIRVCTTRAERAWQAEQSREWVRTGGEMGGVIEVR